MRKLAGGQTASVIHPGIRLQALIPFHHLLQHLLSTVLKTAIATHSLKNPIEDFTDWKMGSGETRDLSDELLEGAKVTRQVAGPKGNRILQNPPQS